MDITANGVKVLELIGDITPQALQDMTQVPLDFSAVLLPVKKSSTHSALAALSK
jgi:3-oxoadipate CoA-transferase beta subunit